MTGILVMPGISPGPDYGLGTIGTVPRAYEKNRAYDS